MINLNHGDVLHVRRLKVHYDLGDGDYLDADFDAGKGRHYVLILLGAHKDEDPPFPAEESLKALGWTPPKDADQEPT